ncbi:MAG: alpha/beta fold hydrolase [Variibacter sp.]
MTPRATPAQTVGALEHRAKLQFTGENTQRIAWRIWGEGPPLLFLHGGAGSWTHWIRTIPDLARDHRVIAPDLPGFGDSDYDNSIDSTARVAERVARHLPEILGRERATIIGFSFGSMVGGYLARDLASHVAALILVGAVGMGLRRRPVAMHSWRALTDANARREAHRANLTALMIHDPAKVDDLALYLQQRNAERTRLRTRGFSRGASPLADTLPHATAPLAGIWGEHDVTVTPHLDERRDFLRRLRPGAPFHVINGIGHWVQYEGADAFNAALRNVLHVLQELKSS